MIQSGSRSHANVEVHGERTIDVRIDNVRRLEQHPVISDDLIKQIKLAFQNAAQAEKNEQDERRDEHRHDDVAHALEDVRTVDLRRFVVFVADSHNGRQVNNRPITQTFPHGEERNDVFPWLGVKVKIVFGKSKLCQCRIYDSVVRIEKIEDERAYQHERYEKRKEHDGLRRFAEPLTRKLAQEDRAHELEGVPD